MKSSKRNNNPKIFLTLEHLLKFELFSSVINLGAGKQKSNSVLSGRYASRFRGRGSAVRATWLYRGGFRAG